MNERIRLNFFNRAVAGATYVSRKLGLFSRYVVFSCVIYCNIVIFNSCFFFLYASGAISGKVLAARRHFGLFVLQKDPWFWEFHKIQNNFWILVFKDKNTFRATSRVRKENVQWNTKSKGKPSIAVSTAADLACTGDCTRKLSPSGN